jgi:hypothetical protein
MATTNRVGAAGIILISIYPFVAGVSNLTSGDTGIAVFMLILSVAGVFIAVRLGLVNVVALPEVLYVRNTFRKLAIPWTEIDHFELGRNDPFAIVGVAVLRNGRRVTLHAIQPPNRLGRPRNRFAEEAIDSLNRLLAERVPTARASSAPPVAPSRRD